MTTSLPQSRLPKATIALRLASVRPCRHGRGAAGASVARGARLVCRYSRPLLLGSIHHTLWQMPTMTLSPPAPAQAALSPGLRLTEAQALLYAHPPVGTEQPGRL